MNDRLPTISDVIGSLPTYRFWGTRKPPKDTAGRLLSLATVRTSGDDPSTATAATIRLYGPIDSWGGFWGVSAKELSQALDSLPAGVDQIQLRINSPGGEVFEAMAMLNMLRAHPATITGVVDGIAASAASFLAAGCDETVMSPGTQMMIHDPRTFAYGPPTVMAKVIKILESLAGSAAELYASIAGGTPAAWRALMIEETWYTATEAVEAGLAQRVDVVPDAAFATTAATDPDDENDLGGDTPDDEPIEDRFDLSVFTYAGRQNAPAPRSISEVAAGPEPEGSPVDLTDEQAALMRTQLGLGDDADAATIVAAMQEALAEQAADAPAPAAPARPAVAALPDGVVAIESSVLDQLRADGAAGRAAHTRQATEDRDRAITAAIGEGRIPPARRAHWVAQWDADPEGAETTLAALEPGTIPVSEIGTSQDRDGEGGSEQLTADESVAVAAFAQELGIPVEALNG